MYKPIKEVINYFFRKHNTNRIDLLILNISKTFINSSRKTHFFKNDIIT